jgi:alginate O-acetyltransferase complex protein AlgI
LLFNSYGFLLLFFPLVLLAYAIFGKVWRSPAVVFVVVSFGFYALWNLAHLALLVGSITANYALGAMLQSVMRVNRLRLANILTASGIVLNLGVLGIFKYSYFIVDNMNMLFDAGYTIRTIILPLGISFFTFEQIGFIVDIRRGASYRLDPLFYTVFVSFFPRLVAGPILRYNEIAPQLDRDSPPRDWVADMAVGLTIFAVGLVKKSFLADGIATYVAAPFDAALAGRGPDLFLAWGGALAYTCQLYFDFSGYSDMAIGAARCLGMQLPQNFNSPYKAVNIVDFWRRWHMTLSRFLRDYVYISLGGNRCGKTRRYLNLMVTMLLGGFWHGANWTFIVWGGLHGIYLVVNHAWSAIIERSGWQFGRTSSAVGCFAGGALTFLAAVIAWVFFRAPSLHGALTMIAAMAGANGAELPAGLAWYLRPVSPILDMLRIRTGWGSGTEFVYTWLWCGALLAIGFLTPNSCELTQRMVAVLEDGSYSHRRLDVTVLAVGTGIAAFLGFLSISRAGVFLYWQF